MQSSNRPLIGLQFSSALLPPRMALSIKMLTQLTETLPHSIWTGMKQIVMHSTAMMQHGPWPLHSIGPSLVRLGVCLCQSVLQCSIKDGILLPGVLTPLILRNVVGTVCRWQHMVCACIQQNNPDIRFMPFTVGLQRILVFSIRMC